MTNRKWVEECYALPQPGKLMDVYTPLPGYRIEAVQHNGQVGLYREDGSARPAVCHLNPIQGLFGTRYAQALLHDQQCPSCGYRIVQDKQALAAFIVEITKSRREGSMSKYLNYAFAAAAGDTSGLALVECTAPEDAQIAHRNTKDAELPGTIRTNRLQLGKRVWMPRWLGGIDQKPLARKVRERYGVTVSVPEQDALTFTNHLTPLSGRSGNGRHGCGMWGMHGAAGVLFTTGQGADSTYWVTKRPQHIYHGGKWSVPGGALDEGETTLQAATREVAEETGLESLAGGSIMGAVEYDLDGWTYTTYLVHVPEPFTVAGNWEIAESRWATGAELESMDLVDGFTAKLPELFGLRATWEDSLQSLRGHTSAGWRA